MNLGKRLIEGLYVWAFYTVLCFLFTPSKREAIAFSLAIAVLALASFMVIAAITLIWRSLARLKKGIPSQPSQRGQVK